MRYYHGTTADSRELMALVGQNGANRGKRNGGVLRFYYVTTSEGLKNSNVKL